MKVETSVHWHGLLLPNFQDGVPYLTTPPIKPGETFTYRFPIRQAGTYWYHSHTMLQEQKGVYGSIVIEPKVKKYDYDRELVLVFSDWTNEDPMHVLKNLKRGNDWYSIKKGTSVPLSQTIGKGAFGAQLNFWKQRMEGADIADVYYPAFLTNGKIKAEYPDLKPGEKVRVRMINASASSYFWLGFGGMNTPTLIAADGVDVEPVKKDRLLFAIAETYDFIVEIPKSGAIEIKATVQDGSGSTSAFLGSGKMMMAPTLDRPDQIEMMKMMAKMDMKMGAPSTKSNPKKDDSHEMMMKYGMKMNHDGMDGMKMKSEEKPMEDHSMHQMPMNKDQTMKMEDHSKMDMSSKNSEKFGYAERKTYFNYDFLKAEEPTNYDKNIPVKEILLNLTGNMNRYTWSLNGVPLSEADMIKIKGNEFTRITLNNLTMMHHPMHLHGHFFRVINENGTYSPMKHTVNVPPMQKVTIEFYGEKDGKTSGDWFFHCHVLYHMMGGMARVFSYDTPRDPRMKDFPAKKIIAETDRLFTWGTADITSSYASLNWVASNMRNELNVKGDIGYNENFEAEVTYNRYINDFFRVYGGVNFENENHDSFDKISTVGIAGIKYFTPYMFFLDVRLDTQLRPQIGLDKDFLIFPKTVFYGDVEYRMDFGWVNDLPQNKHFDDEWKWSTGLKYFLSRNFSLTGGYHNVYGWNAGLSVRF